VNSILSSIACNLDAGILSASLPLFAEERIEAIEWSFDTLFNYKEVPSWFLELLHTYSREKRLVGHGVFFSLFSGRFLPEQHSWLKHLEKMAAEFHFDHITEHFGFMTGKDFHHGAPLNIPYSDVTLRIGRDRLARIQDACKCPVGLENLAFSYSLDEVKRHGEFLERLIEPVNGFIILDLHNLYCQLHNFSVPYHELIALYPLDRVREIHISGGSWENAVSGPERKIRRDTHDDAVPASVFELLRRTIPKCPNLKYVVMEQMGVGLRTEASKLAFYQDFIEMQGIVQELQDRPAALLPVNSFMPLQAYTLAPAVAENELLYAQQMQLSDILETAASYQDAMQALLISSLAGTEWQVERWDADMLETAIHIAQKWKKTI
jgi:uncharacterized protein (UPF0276 family)